MGIHVVLVEPEIHWNTGNVGRTCLAAGAQLHLVAPLGFRLGEREVRRAGLDYWERVQPVLWSHLPALEAELPRLGAPFFVSPEARTSFWDAEYPEDVVLLFGKESTGFTSAVRERWKERMVSVPMRAGSVRSLNLSTCAALVLYEVVRRRAGAQLSAPAADDLW